MKIYYSQVGGFAGIALSTEVDINSRPSEDRQRIQTMIDSARFFSLPSQFPSPKEGADYLIHKITIETEKSKHTVETTDLTMPNGLWPLVKYLIKESKSRY